jgi:putative two-component system response regulator
MRILLVDDDDLALEALSFSLIKAGHEPVIARNGRDALEALKEGSFHLVISDWVMPEMDGLELCRQIRSGEFGGYVYVILLTARNTNADIVEGLSAGADDFLTKPFNPAELQVRVRTGERIASLETRDVAIFAMAKLAESRDPETGEHLERMRKYSRIIAQDISGKSKFRNQISPDFARLIYLTSPLHDIGKVGIPDAVLLKPGRLSDREFDIMKTHTTIGAETLDAAVREYPGVEYLRFARDIALTHHERFDGSGYPSGLAGFDIPLSGRVVALADVYDALTSRRVYKAALAHDVACSMINDESGKHFDPEIVESFRQNEEEFLKIRDCSSRSEVVAAV